jgi:hypothetical protein
MAAQAVRRRDPSRYWSELSPSLLQHAHELARLAANSELVVFFGAGVSTGAGLPDWRGLIEQLVEEVRLGPEFGQVTDRFLDWAAVIEAQYGARSAETDGRPRNLRTAIAEIFTQSCPRSTLTQTLLAGLPVNEFATMNYDRLFELAAESAEAPVAVLPWQTTKGVKRWLLKMHGSVDHPEDIVLTRADYLRYSETRGALRGLVQALLITRHMLFVGFGLTDDNFYRIADDVRRAVHRAGAEPEPFGTALALKSDPLTAALWKRDLHVLALSDDDDDDPKLRRAAWRLDVFLDYMLAEATTVSRYLLDDRYAEILTSEEERLRDAVRTFVRQLADARVDLRRWPTVREMLQSVGEPTVPQDADRTSATRDTPRAV